MLVCSDGFDSCIFEHSCLGCLEASWQCALRFATESAVTCSRSFYYDANPVPMVRIFTGFSAFLLSQTSFTDHRRSVFVELYG